MPFSLCTSRFSASGNGATRYLPYCRSHSLSLRNTNITRAVFALHGADPIAQDYFQNTLNAAQSISASLVNETLIVAPQFIKQSELREIIGAVPNNNVLLWTGERFEGGLSDSRDAAGNVQPFRVSSFTVLDRMLQHVITSGNFPNLRRIVILGQSGGGCFTNIFAASSRFQQTFANPAGIFVRYIVMNPGAYLYFSAERVRPVAPIPLVQFNFDFDFEVPTDATIDAAIAFCNALGGSDCDTRQDCRNEYNKYAHGLDDLANRSEYHQDNGLTRDDLAHHYSNRNVIHLVGSEDRIIGSNRRHTGVSSVDVLQGKDRLERAVFYFAHLHRVFGENWINRFHRLEIVPGVGHGGRGMITSASGCHYIFEDFEEVKMTTLADYKVVRDTKFNLRSGQEESFELVLPGDLVRSGNSKRPMISFFADPSGDAQDLKCRIEVNGQRVVSYTYSGGVGRQHTEVLRHDQLNSGETNRIQFRVESGRGSVGFSDVVLWYQRNVEISG